MIKPVKPELGKVFVTRDGREVRIEAKSVNRNYRGVMIDNGAYCFFSRKGKGADHNLDLIRYA